MRHAWIRAAALLGVAVLAAGCKSNKKMDEPRASAPPPSSSSAPPPAPAPAPKASAIEIDNLEGSGHFSVKGSWNQDPAGGDFGGTDAHWTTPDGEASARWETKLPTGGNWKVYIWYGGDPNNDHATDAAYCIETADGPKTVKLNQKENQSQWNLVGAFRFTTAMPAAVVLSNKADGNVIADAVKFAPE